MSRAPSIHAVHPTTDPKGGIYPAEIQRIRNKIKLGDKISVNTEKGYVNINPDSTKPGNTHRRGTVIAKHKHLVVLEYPGGLTEAFRWAEMADKAI